MKNSDKSIIEKAFEAAFVASDTLTKDFGDDGGACNFDTATIRMAKGERSAPYEKAAKAAGFDTLVSDVGYSRRVFVTPPRIAGQGDARTRQARAIHCALKAYGLDSYIYYQMD